MTKIAGYRSLLAVFSMAVLASLPQNASASSIIFQRALPMGANFLNNTGMANNTCAPNPNCRANISWLSGQTSGGTYFVTGDDFTLSTPATVSSITVYEVANNNDSTGLANSLPTSEFNSLSLYMGTNAAPLTLTTSAYTFQRVQYPPGIDYQSASGMFPIYAITFTLPNTLFAPGTYDFAIDPTLNTANPAYCNTVGNPNCYGLFLAASNGAVSALSGAIEQGVDDQFIYFGEANQAAQAPAFSNGGFCNSGNVSCGGWDKSSDLNVTIGGAFVLPEPSTFGLVTIAMAGAALIRRRRRK